MSRMIIVAALAVLLGAGAFALYGETADGGNPVAAPGVDPAALQAARVGEMTKLVVHDAPKPRLESPFQDGDGAAVSLADYAGKVVVLNFWATWCPPCRKEMPSLDRLAAAMAGDDVAVLALSVDRFGAERIRAFYDEIGVTHLAILQDRRSAVAREAGALGLPVTLILDRQGRELARLTGEAEWDSVAVKTILDYVLEATAPQAAGGF